MVFSVTMAIDLAQFERDVAVSGLHRHLEKDIMELSTQTGAASDWRPEHARQRVNRKLCVAFST